MASSSLESPTAFADTPTVVGPNKPPRKQAAWQARTPVEGFLAQRAAIANPTGTNGPPPKPARKAKPAIIQLEPAAASRISEPVIVRPPATSMVRSGMAVPPRTPSTLPTMTPPQNKAVICPATVVDSLLLNTNGMKTVIICSVDT